MEINLMCGLSLTVSVFVHRKIFRMELLCLIHLNFEKKKKTLEQMFITIITYVITGPNLSSRCSKIYMYDKLCIDK